MKALVVMKSRIVAMLSHQRVWITDFVLLVLLMLELAFGLEAFSAGYLTLLAGIWAYCDYTTRLKEEYITKQRLSIYTKLRRFSRECEDFAHWSLRNSTAEAFNCKDEEGFKPLADCTYELLYGDGQRAGPYSGEQEAWSQASVISREKHIKVEIRRIPTVAEERVSRVSKNVEHEIERIKGIHARAEEQTSMGGVEIRQEICEAATALFIAITVLGGKVSSVSLDLTGGIKPRNDELYAWLRFIHDSRTPKVIADVEEKAKHLFKVLLEARP